MPKIINDNYEIISISSDQGSVTSLDEYLPSPSPTPKKTHKGRKRSLKSNSPMSPSPIKKSRKGRPKGENNKEEKGGKNNRKTGSWTKEEVRDLWNALELLPVKVRWDDIAERVPGRDKLSCQNKWRYDMLPKIQAFIETLGN
ncbi:uncharacterized protein L201_000649 [Kwoniella dendrophila CBS 6074]|uniref:Myb-like domain-containing protein n=1 Tax=Kwoniella dendrophila CBS 6074 TaxID=1295534 RepID=A0AAX4JMZ7_9TREE